MHYPVNIILPNESASLTMKEAVINLTNVLIYSKKLFESLEERIKKLKDEIHSIDRCQKLVLQKIQNNQNKKIVKQCSYPDYFLRNEVKSLLDLNEQSQTFKSTLCPALAENVNSLNNFLAYFNDVQVRKLPINKEETISCDRSLIDLHAESYMKYILGGEDTYIDENNRLKINETALSQPNNDTCIDPIPYSLMPEKFRILINEKSLYIQKRPNSFVSGSGSESNITSYYEEKDKKLNEKDTQNENIADTQKEIVPDVSPFNNNFPQPPPLAEVCKAKKPEENKSDIVPIEYTDTPGRGNLLEEIRKAKGGTGTLKLKSVCLTEVKPVTHPIKPINIFNEINDRLSQRRKHIKSTDEPIAKSTPMAKFMEKISIKDDLMDREHIEEF